MVQYRVQLFAEFRDMVGREHWDLGIGKKISATELLRRFFEEYQSLAGLANVTRLAVNHHFAEKDAILEPDDELALIPPVSGG